MSDFADDAADMHRAFRTVEMALEADGFTAVDIGLGMIGYAAGLLSREAGSFIALRAFDEAKRAMLEGDQATVQ